MKIVVSPMTDSKPHDLWSTTCECGCIVDFINGDMNIVHQAYDKEKVSLWGVFEEDKQAL